MMKSMFGMMMPILTASMANNNNGDQSSEKMMGRMMDMQMNSMKSIGTIMQKNTIEDIKTMAEIKREAILATTEPEEKNPTTMEKISFGMQMFEEYAPDIINNFKMITGDGMMSKAARTAITGSDDFKALLKDEDALLTFLTQFETKHGQEATEELATKLGLL